MQRLDERFMRLPGFKGEPSDLLGTRVLIGVGGRIVSTTRPNADPELISCPAVLCSTLDGLAVCTPPHGVLWRAAWPAIGEARWRDVSGQGLGPRSMLFELTSTADDGVWRLLLVMPALALFISEPRPMDNFLLHPSVQPHLRLTEAADLEPALTFGHEIGPG